MFQSSKRVVCKGDLMRLLYNCWKTSTCILIQGKTQKSSGMLSKYHHVLILNSVVIKLLQWELAPLNWLIGVVEVWNGPNSLCRPRCPPELILYPLNISYPRTCTYLYYLIPHTCHCVSKTYPSHPLQNLSSLSLNPCTLILIHLQCRPHLPPTQSFPMPSLFHSRKNSPAYLL